MAHRLEVVAPVYFVEPAIGGPAVGFLELGRVVLGTGEWAFALPVEDGEAFDGSGRVELEEGGVGLLVGHDGRQMFIRFQKLEQPGRK